MVEGRTLPVKFRIETGAVAVIGSQGGTAVFENGKVELTFPAGATDTELGCDGGAVYVRLLRRPGVSLRERVVVFNPSPVSFDEPVTLTFDFPVSLPQGIHADRLVVCKMVGGACVPVPGSTASPATRTVSANIQLI